MEELSNQCKVVFVTESNCTGSLVSYPIWGYFPTDFRSSPEKTTLSWFPSSSMNFDQKIPPYRKFLRLPHFTSIFLWLLTLEYIIIRKTYIYLVVLISAAQRRVPRRTAPSGRYAGALTTLLRFTSVLASSTANSSPLISAHKPSPFNHMLSFSNFQTCPLLPFVNFCIEKVNIFSSFKYMEKQNGSDFDKNLFRCWNWNFFIQPYHWLVKIS
jgi:hypothetical protein